MLWVKKQPSGYRFPGFRVAAKRGVTLVMRPGVAGRASGQAGTLAPGPPVLPPLLHAVVPAEPPTPERDHARLAVLAGNRAGLGQGLLSVPQPIGNAVSRRATARVPADGVLCAPPLNLIFDHPCSFLGEAFG